MAKPAVPYKIIGIKRGGVIREKGVRGAPTEASMCAWSVTNQFVAVIRYFPSRRGWRILDTEMCVRVSSGGNGRMFDRYSGHIRGNRYWPTEEAAVMYALTKLS